MTAARHPRSSSTAETSRYNDSGNKTIRAIMTILPSTTPDAGHRIFSSQLSEKFPDPINRTYEEQRGVISRQNNTSVALAMSTKSAEQLHAAEEIFKADSPAKPSK